MQGETVQQRGKQHGVCTFDVWSSSGAHLRLPPGQRDPIVLCTEALYVCKTQPCACRVRLYSKGADSMIYARLLPDQAVADSSQPHLADMARQGLRTLCLAQKDISDQDYQV